MTNIPGENVEDRGIGNQSKENNETQNDAHRDVNFTGHQRRFQPLALLVRPK